MTLPVATASAVSAVAVDGRGRVVVAGTAAAASPDFVVARLNPDGTPDPTFGGTGVVTVPVGPGADTAFAVAVDPAGRVLVGGSRQGAGGSDFALVRLRDDGTPDPGFGGGDGIVVTPSGGLFGIWAAVAVDPAGRIVVAGGSDPGAGGRPLPGRREPGPGIQPDRGGDRPGHGRALALGVAVDPAGRVVAAGASAAGEVIVARLTGAGDPDPTFDGDGVAITPLGPQALAGGVAVDAGGRVVVGGFGYGPDAMPNFMAARYLDTGALDPTFGGAGTGVALVSPARPRTRPGTWPWTGPAASSSAGSPAPRPGGPSPSSGSTRTASRTRRSAPTG